MLFKSRLPPGCVSTADHKVCRLATEWERWVVSNPYLIHRNVKTNAHHSHEVELIVVERQSAKAKRALHQICCHWGHCLG